MLFNLDSSEQELGWRKLRGDELREVGEMEGDSDSRADFPLPARGVCLAAAAVAALHPIYLTTGPEISCYLLL